jgi:IPT/TIG domain
MSVTQVPETRSRARPQARTTVGGSPVSVPGIVILSVFMSAVALLALYGLWRFWPAASPTSGSPPATAKFSYFGWNVTLTRDQQFFVVTAFAGVIGAMLHGLRSMSTYVGERYLFRSWIPYYILLPIVGGLLATIVYLVLRAGLLPGAGTSSQPDPYGITAVGALVGLFSAQAAEKLKAVFETLFTKAETGSDSIVDIATPAITGFAPPQGAPGSEVVISGDNLTSVTGVAFTGAGAPNFKIVSKNRLTVTVPPGATTGPITLQAGQGHVVSEEDFTVGA